MPVDFGIPSNRVTFLPRSDVFSFAGQPYLAASSASFFASSAALALAAAAFASSSLGSAFFFSACWLTIGPSLHDHQGRMNDVGVSAAAADVAVESLPDLFFGRLGILGEECPRCD